MEDFKIFQHFTNASKDTFKNTAQIVLTDVGEYQEVYDDLTSFGATAVVGFIGKLKGRLILDFEPEVALNLTSIICDETYTSILDDMVVSTLSEIGNIIAGDAITHINNEMSFSLRLAPPIVFLGEDVFIGINNMKTFSSILSCEYGRIKVNISYEGNQ